MTKLKRLRKRALAILEDKGSSFTPLPIDYAIDDWLRTTLQLPSRPINQNPYEGWLTENKTLSVEKKATSDTGVALIKRWEGFRSKAYLCPGNVWTIGYGHTAGVKQGDTVSKLEAEQMLKRDLHAFENAVNKFVTTPINQNQFDALVSFVYNVGVRAFLNSTLRKILNQGKYSEVDKQLMRWVYANKKRLPGLVKRRRAEAELFNS